MTSIKELGERIATNTAKIDAWLAAQNNKAPSFDQDSDAEFPSTEGNAEIEAAKLAILDDTNTLHDLTQGPGEVIRRLCWGVRKALRDKIRVVVGYGR